MKKKLSALLAICLVFSLCACEGGAAVSVMPVSMLNGGGSAGFLDRCAGKIVSGETAKVKKDANQKILEVYVKEGDTVQEGDKLFAYDAAAMQLELEKLELELKNLENSIASDTEEVAELERLKNLVYYTEQLEYTIRIDTTKPDIREAEYNLNVKKREIEAKKAALEATEVYSPLSGRVMSVSENTGTGDAYMYGNGGGDDSFITVMDVSHYRVEGHINELNLGSLSEGMRVLVRSRSGEDGLWHGTISAIDWNNPVSGNQDGMVYYMGGSDEMTSSSKYPFYIELDDTAALILGQHVIIEPDYGQGELGDGIWLPGYYVSDAESSPYVWAVSAKDKLEKRSVTLGEYSPETDLWQIAAGLALTDYIAAPGETVHAGASVIRYGEKGFDTAGGEGGEEGEIVEDMPVELPAEMKVVG